MEALVKELVEKLGLNKGVAEKIGSVLQEHAANVPKMLTLDPQEMTQTLQKAGISSTIADKVVAFLKEHATEIPTWLGSQGGGIFQKAKDMVGSVLGSKESK